MRLLTPFPLEVKKYVNPHTCNIKMKGEKSQENTALSKQLKQMEISSKMNNIKLIFL